MPEKTAKKRGRPRKVQVQITHLLDYLEALPAANPTKQRLTPDKMLVIARCVQELQYLDGTLARLKEDVATHGEVEEFVQGKQRLRRANPALEQYFTAVRNYKSLVRQVSDILRGTELDVAREW